MKANILGEDDESVVVELFDNIGTEHAIAVGFDGAIVEHGQDGYPDGAYDRTDEQDEMIDQARDYARWYVAQETEYETAPWYLDSDGLKAVREDIDALSEDEVRRYFHHYYRQLAGEYDDEITQPRSDPVTTGEAYNEYREYKLDIYLTDDGDIEATSGVHVMYYAEYNEDRLNKGEDPYPERDPDGRLEHVVLDIDWDEFDAFLDYHLRCQIRDSYLARGEQPPEEYRVLGPGTDHMMIRQMHLDAVEPYHDYDATIDGYRAEDSFNAGVFAPLVDML
jgi:hypothetical protein